MIQEYDKNNARKIEVYHDAGFLEHSNLIITREKDLENPRIAGGYYRALSFELIWSSASRPVPAPAPAGTLSRPRPSPASRPVPGRSESAICPVIWSPAPCPSPLPAPADLQFRPATSDKKNSTVLLTSTNHVMYYYDKALN